MTAAGVTGEVMSVQAAIMTCVTQHARLVWRPCSALSNACSPQCNIKMCKEHECIISKITSCSAYVKLLSGRANAEIAVRDVDLLKHTSRYPCYLRVVELR